MTSPPPSDNNNASGSGKKQYISRKPKWWIQLSNRKGTKAQRQAIQRMTHCGYYISKDVLIDFCRVSNYGAQQQQSSIIMLDKWKRYWWNKALGIVDISSSRYDHPNIGINDLVSSNKQNSDNNEKYAQKINDMYQYECPLPSQEYKQIWLEIGFGSGLNLLANAKQHPDILFLGCEIHQPGVGTILQNIEKELNASETPTSTSSSPYQNIRILPGDGIKLLKHFPANYIDAILITFPDPWPNENEHDWRVIQSGILKEMQSVLVSCGRVYVATDAECFNDWTRYCIKDTPHWKEVTPTPNRSSWLPVVSYYEQKGLDEGRKTMLQCWEKIE